jgi:acetyl-CoA acetyltransferase
MTNIVISSAARTAVGSYGKSLKDIAPTQLGTIAAKEAMSRAQIDPTVRHAIRISSATALREHWTASHAVWSSKERVNRDPWRAHGTAQTTTSCSRQRTLGASASTNASVVPRSRARQRRRPSPRSNPGLRRRQIPQRSRS